MIAPGPLESCHKCLKRFKKYLSRFTGLGPHLKDVYKRLFWQNSPLIRKYERKTKSKKNKIAPLKSNSLDDQLSHHIALKTDDQLIDYFINGGQADSDNESGSESDNESDIESDNESDNESDKE